MSPTNLAGEVSMAMTKECVSKFLEKRNALIVHFASVPLLSGKRLSYPESLSTVITNIQLQISCSVVQPGDVFGPYAEPKHATGMIGLILRPVSNQSVIAVSDYDAGSLAQPDGTRYFTPMTVTCGDLHNSMEKRGTQAGPCAAYNEWGMKDYEIRGLFVASPDQNLFAKEGVIEPFSEHISVTRQRFPELEIYTFSNGCIAAIDAAGNHQATTHGVIYPP